MTRAFFPDFPLYFAFTNRFRNNFFFFFTNVELVIGQEFVWGSVPQRDMYDSARV